MKRARTVALPRPKGTRATSRVHLGITMHPRELAALEARAAAASMSLRRYVAALLESDPEDVPGAKRPTSVLFEEALGDVPAPLRDKIRRLAAVRGFQSSIAATKARAQNIADTAAERVSSAMELAAHVDRHAAELGALLDVPGRLAWENMTHEVGRLWSFRANHACRPQRCEVRGARRLGRPITARVLELWQNGSAVRVDGSAAEALRTIELAPGDELRCLVSAPADIVRLYFEVP